MDWYLVPRPVDPRSRDESNIPMAFRRDRLSELSTGTGNVVVNRSMSLDGFIAGPGDAMDWIFDFVAPDEFPEIAAATGAMLIGRRTYDVGNRMNVAGAAGPGGQFPQR